MKIKLLIALVFFCNSVSAQIGFWEQSQFNYSSINPAYIGERGSFSVNGILGNQFNGTIRPNQISQIVTIDGQLYGNKSNLGFNGFRGLSSNGVFSNSMYLSYSYAVSVNDLKIKIGVNTGLLVVPVASISAVGNSVSPFVGFGFSAFYKGLIAGISNPIAFSKNNLFSSKPYFINAGYLFKPASNLSFSVMTIYEHNTEKIYGNAVTINPKLILNDKFAFGVSARSRFYTTNESNQTSLIPILQYQASSGIQFGISYNHNPRSQNTQNLNLANSGVAQLMVRIQTDKENKGLLNGF
jgi:hypothetical protein